MEHTSKVMHMQRQNVRIDLLPEGVNVVKSSIGVACHPLSGRIMSLIDEHFARGLTVATGYLILPALGRMSAAHRSRNHSS
jgi:hypothetical protein